MELISMALSADLGILCTQAPDHLDPAKTPGHSWTGIRAKQPANLE